MPPKKIPFTEFKSIYSRVPRLTVELIIKNSKGILLTLRNIEPYKGFWHLPGGTVLYGESVENAIERVALEELGVKVEIKKLLGYIQYPDEEKVREFGWSIGLAFLLRVKSGELRGSDQGEKIAFFKKLPEKTVPDQKHYLKKTFGSFLE